MSSNPRCLLYPLNEAARTLRVPATWLRAEADAGRLPHLRAGKAYLFDLEFLERVLTERARQYPADAGGASHAN